MEAFGGLDSAFNNAGIEQLRGGGAIVNTSSGAGLTGFAGGAAYAAVKFGIIGATKCAALDYASSGIRINAVCPGIIDTQMIERVFGDIPEGRQAVLDQESIGRMGAPKKSPQRWCGCAPREHPSPSGTPCSSTAARPPDRQHRS